MPPGCGGEHISPAVREFWQGMRGLAIPLGGADSLQDWAERATLGRGQDTRARQHPSTWSSTMPADCISAYIVVGPTKRNPRFRSALLIASDSGVVAGDIGEGRGRGPASGAKDQMERVELAGSISRSRRALEIVASIFARLRMMPASAISRSMSRRRTRRRARVEPGEHLAEPRALAQDRDPRQPRLEALEAHLLEERAVAVERAAPLLVVVRRYSASSPTHAQRATPSGPILTSAVTGPPYGASRQPPDAVAQRLFQSGCAKR